MQIAWIKPTSNKHKYSRSSQHKEGKEGENVIVQSTQMVHKQYYVLVRPTQNK